MISRSEMNECKPQFSLFSHLTQVFVESKNLDVDKRRHKLYLFIFFIKILINYLDVYLI
jgi:hypothetical protein